MRFRIFRRWIFDVVARSALALRDEAISCYVRDCFVGEIALLAMTGHRRIYAS
jgi:hypothetical protein